MLSTCEATPMEMALDVMTPLAWAVLVHAPPGKVMVDELSQPAIAMANSAALVVAELVPVAGAVDEPAPVLVMSTVGDAPIPVTSVREMAAAQDREKFAVTWVTAAAFLHHHISKYCGFTSCDAAVIFTQVFDPVSVGVLIVMDVLRAEMHRMSVLPESVGDVAGVMLSVPAVLVMVGVAAVERWAIAI